MRRRAFRLVGDAGGDQRLGDRPGDGPVGVERAVRVLEHHLDAGAAVGGGGLGAPADRERPAAQRDAARQGGRGGEQRPGDRRLARARLADERERLAAGDAEADAGDRRHPRAGEGPAALDGELLDEVGDAQQFAGRAGRWHRVTRRGRRRRRRRLPLVPPVRQAGRRRGGPSGHRGWTSAAGARGERMPAAQAVVAADGGQAGLPGGAVGGRVAAARAEGAALRRGARVRRAAVDRPGQPAVGVRVWRRVDQRLGVRHAGAGRQVRGGQRLDDLPGVHRQPPAGRARRPGPGRG